MKAGRGNASSSRLQWLDKQYELFRQDPFHPSLHLKQVAVVCTVRVGRSYRAIGYREGGIFRWGWIGSHESYNKLFRRMK